MPLAFESVTHGQVAFGFFNIDTDMLLLEHYFLFAPEFCQYIRELARSPEPEAFSAQWEVYDIPDRERIGDLMGAIHGIRFTGFIGRVYQRFPFPKIPEAFKQQPEGYKNRDIVEEIIREYAVEVQIPFVAQNGRGHVQIGEYEFQRPWFFELVRYVWLGGYPRWRDGLRPEYVMKMKQEIMGSRSGFFNGIVLDEL
ncbi:MAG: hypothetical protein DRG63_04810 [Deltaproteobacteria bacterium]|nr:MAG: hypothetical protein DRG63_04810 [Deltaproteobacteria bacterium]